MNECFTRLQRLQQQMAANGIDGFIIAQNVDLYYLTGSMQSGFLFVPVQGEPVYYVRRSVIRAQVESAFRVEPLGSLRSFGANLTSSFPGIFGQDRKPAIAAEYDVLPVQLFHRLEAAIPHVRWVDGSLIIRELRMIKSAGEIENIRAAAAVIDRAFELAVSRIRPGLAEYELMSIVEQSIRREGHLGLIRMRGFNQETITGMIGAGEAAATPTYFDGPAGGQGLSPASPQSSGTRPIRANEPILIDIGCCLDGYVIDQTRTVVIGDLPSGLLEAYETAERILRSTETQLKPGTVCQDLYRQSLEMAERAGLADHFMGYGQDRVKFLGHGIGLEIDELPVLAKGFTYPLTPGMVIAIEPKFTFPGQGVVGIEDTYAITEDGFDKLTVSRSGLVRL